MTFVTGNGQAHLRGRAGIEAEILFALYTKAALAKRL
jgi:hypothetical protein